MVCDDNTILKDQYLPSRNGIVQKDVLFSEDEWINCSDYQAVLCTIFDEWNHSYT